MKDIFTVAPELNKDQRQLAEKLIFDTNYKRAKIVAIVTIIIEIVLIAIFDVNLLIKGPRIGLSVEHQYMYLHFSMLFLAVATLMLTMAIRVTHNSSERFNHFMLWTIGVLFLSAVGYLTGLEQVRSNQVVAFIVVIVVAGNFMLIKPPLQIVILGIPGMVFLLSIMKYQSDNDILVANMANGIIFMFTMSAVSVAVYRQAYNKIAKEILLRARNEQLEFLAHHDYLTGLLNRRSFEAEMTRNHLSKLDDEVVGLVLMDLDHFKRINDIYGHDKADDVLINISEILKRHTGEDGIVARWGGEEFIFLLHGDDVQALEDDLENIRSSIENTPARCGDVVISTTGSFGMTFIRSNTPEELKYCFNLADEALYESKAKGRNCVSIRSL